MSLEGMGAKHVVWTRSSAWNASWGISFSREPSARDVIIRAPPVPKGINVQPARMDLSWIRRLYRGVLTARRNARPSKACQPSTASWMTNAKVNSDHINS